jgi:hypothetical protein
VCPSGSVPPVGPGRYSANGGCWCGRFACHNWCFLADDRNGTVVLVLGCLVGTGTNKLVGGRQARVRGGGLVVVVAGAGLLPLSPSCFPSHGKIITRWKASHTTAGRSLWKRNGHLVRHLVPC